MSRPPVRRTVAGMRARSSTCLNAAIASRDEPPYIPVGLYGIRLTLKARLRRAAPRARRRAAACRSRPRASRTRCRPCGAGGRRSEALGEHVGERVAVVHRHQLRAQGRSSRRAARAQRDRLVDLVDEPVEAGEPADGRDRRAAMGDPDVGQPPCGLDHVVEVDERLAHPHEDALVDLLEPSEVQRLVEDLDAVRLRSICRTTRTQRPGSSFYDRRRVCWKRERLIDSWR